MAIVTTPLALEIARWSRTLCAWRAEALQLELEGDAVAAAMYASAAAAAKVRLARLRAGGPIRAPRQRAPAGKR